MARARVRRSNGLAAVLSVTLIGAFGVPRVSAQTQTPLPVATAAKVTTPVRLDGVLDDAAWAQALPIKGMLQVEPVHGAAPSEDTEVRVVYDANNLYFGIICRDRTPSGIVSTQLGR